MFKVKKKFDRKTLDEIVRMKLESQASLTEIAQMLNITSSDVFQCLTTLIYNKELAVKFSNESSNDIQTQWYKPKQNAIVVKNGTGNNIKET